MAVSAIFNTRVLFITLTAMLVLASGLVVAPLMASPVGAQTVVTTSTQTDPFLARGEYLVTAGPCTECHTQRLPDNSTALDTSMLLAGGEEFALPFGTVYSANITSDVETGIGGWSVIEIVRALEEGIGKDGSQLVLMPWQEFRGMATEDKIAIAFYLKSTAAISNEVPEADLRAPRAALHADAALSSHEPGSGAPPEASDVYGTGEYLLWNVLRCTGCHGGDLKGNIPPMFAPDLTAETGAASMWTQAELATAFTTGVRPDGSMIAPVMPWGDAGYGHVTDADAQAVASYLKTARAGDIAAVVPAPPAPVIIPAPDGGDVALNPAILAVLAMVLLGGGLGLLRPSFLRRRRISG
jgi:mono/diheme cytochrome c family protein